MQIRIDRIIYKKISIGVLFVICVINPALSSLWSIKGCLENRRGAYCIVALFAGIIGLLLFPPIGDQYRHALEYYNLKGYPLSDYLLISFATGKIDFALSLLKYYFGILDLPYGYIRTFLVVISSLLFLDLYDRLSYNRFKEKKYILLGIFLIYPLAAICSGMRFGFGICLLAYVFCNRIYIGRKRAIDYLLIALAICFHTGCIIFIIIFLLSKIYPKHINKSSYITLALSTLFVSTSLCALLVYLPLPYPLNEYVSEYLYGKYTNSGYVTENLNFIGRAKTYFMLYAPLGIVVYYNLKSYHSGTMSSFYNLLVLAWIATLPLFSLNGRILSFTMIMGGLNLIHFAKSEDLKRVFLIWTFIIVFGIILNWRMIPYLRIIDLFLPLPICLNSDYDETWILNNVNEDGIFKPYW